MTWPDLFDKPLPKVPKESAYVWSSSDEDDGEAHSTYTHRTGATAVAQRNKEVSLIPACTMLLFALCSDGLQAPALAAAAPVNVVAAPCVEA